MANPTLTLIASSTVGSGGVATVTFSSIPATYTDLVVKCSARSTSTSDTTIILQYNGVGTSHSSLWLQGNGSSASSSSQSNVSAWAFGYTDQANNTSNTFSSHDIYIPNYTSSNYKSMSADSIQENNATGAIGWLTAGLFSNTSAITSMILLPGTGNFVQYSSFYLYGIKNS